MPDPLQKLPNELCSLCIELVIDGEKAGALEVFMVSKRWQRFLIGTPSLWTSIYIQDGEDESARISTFLHLSKTHQLHLDIMAVDLPPETLQLVAENMFRVKSISIRPRVMDNTTFLTESWPLAASATLARLSNGLLPSDTKDVFCSGISLDNNGQLHYHPIAIQLALSRRENGRGNKSLTIPVHDMEKFHWIWVEFFERYVSFTRAFNSP